MFGFLKRLFSPAPVENVDFKALVKEGAVILDVRTINEFNSGHIKGAKNIPVQVISGRIEEVRKYNKIVIAHCRSGQRSGLATKILNKNGIKTYNGGAYETLKAIIK